MRLPRPVAPPLLAAALAVSFAGLAPAQEASPPAPPPSPAPSPGPSAPAGPTGPLGPADPLGLGRLEPFGASGQVTSGTAFNPSISVIPDLAWFTDDADGASPGLLGEIDGFHGGHAHGEEGHVHGGAGERGFGLREAEVAFSGAVDPYFDAWAVFAVAAGEVEVEEAYVQTRRLLPGLQLRAGRFLSGLGYLNRQHPHQWAFVDHALPYSALLGGSLGDTGVQATYLPDLPFYAQLGVEALQGENEGIALQLGGEGSPFFDEKPGPRLLAAFLKIAPEVGYSHALQLGASAALSRRHQEVHAHHDEALLEEGETAEPVPEEALGALQGRAWLLGLDVAWRYDSGRQHGHRDLAVQAEYLRRVKDLDLLAEGDEALAPPARHRFVQDGLYAQATYGFAPRWTAGVRLDVVGLANHLETDEGTTAFEDSRRLTAALTFDPTEFSRLRAQWERGSFAVGGHRETFQQFHLQLQVSLGAHGAHRF